MIFSKSQCTKCFYFILFDKRRREKQAADRSTNTVGRGADECKRQTRTGESGLYGAAAPRHAPPVSYGNLSPGRFAPRGEKPLRFSPHPFFGVCEKNMPHERFFSFERPAFSGHRIAYGNRFTRGLNARVHSPPARSRATRSQRPCVFGGCGRLFLPIMRICVRSDNSRFLRRKYTRHPAKQTHAFCEAAAMRGDAQGKAARGSIPGYVIRLRRGYGVTSRVTPPRDASIRAVGANAAHEHRFARHFEQRSLFARKVSEGVH